VADWKGKTVKQVNALYIDPVYQNVAYRYALQELTGQPWTGHIMNIPREGGGAIVMHRIEPPPGAEWTFEGMMDGFRACRILYRNEKDFEKKGKR
jgi:hypothetical protein